jgi:mannosyl-glycoprotein endo-beta-N-acetylglucosaminidase/LysM domain-containing protein
MLGKRNIIFLILISFLPAILSAQTPARDAYINRFREIAISEMERTGIPASIKLAQGILESGDGNSTLARKANNHFGIKCHNTWNGKTYYIEDDDYDENGKLTKSCFRVYKNADASYIAHSEFLRDPNKRYRYGFLFSLPTTDYKAWAKGLKQAGYATSPTYAEKLIRVIETSELYRFDKMSSLDVTTNDKMNEKYERLHIRFVNDAKITLAEEGETAADIAARTNMSANRILKYNERISSKNQKIKKDTRVFLQRKRSNFRGKKKWHYVQEGESLFDVSQLYGVRLSKLQKKNRIPESSEPKVGERIKIRGWFKIKKSDTPKLQSKSDMLDDSEEFIEDFDEETIEIEIPPSSVDDEEFDEDIVPETPDSEIFDEPVIEEEPILPDTIPVPVIDSTTTTDPVIIDNPTTGVYYLTVKGDTLFSISKKYGTTVEAIKRLNNLTNNSISIGQQLRIF